MRKSDEENFEEAEAQAYRCWTPTVVPSEIQQLFTLQSSSSSSSSFPVLLSALSQFTQHNPASPQYPSGVLPLTSGLPDMKASTEQYVELQKMYRAQAEAEKKVFKSYLSQDVDDATVDTFLKNAHALKVLKGREWREVSPGSPPALGKYFHTFVNALIKFPVCSEQTNITT